MGVLLHGFNLQNDTKELIGYIDHVRTHLIFTVDDCTLETKSIRQVTPATAGASNSEHALFALEAQLRAIIVEAKPGGRAFGDDEAA
jgi:hypothetical protein